MSSHCYCASDWSSPQLLALVVAIEEYGDTLPQGSAERDCIREAVRQIGLADKHAKTVASAAPLSLPTAETLGDGIIADANEVRNTQQTSDMVERVAGILRKSRELNMSWNDANRLARVVLEVIPLRITEGKNPWGKGTAYGDAWEMGHSAALEASHHADMVERVARLRRFIETRKRLVSPSAADEQRLIADLEAIITHHAELVGALRQTTEIVGVRYNADSAPTLERVERENRELLTKIGGAS